MIKKYLVIIPFNLPWDWSTDYTNQTAYELARKGNVVICYMWGESYTFKEYVTKKQFPVLIKKDSSNIYLYYPILFIPFRRYRVVVRINEIINIYLVNMFVGILSLIKSCNKKILWIFDPKLYPLVQKFSKNYFLLYDCVDYFLGTCRSESEKNILTKNEYGLVNKANLVVSNSKVLVKHLSKLRRDVYFVPQGFRVDSFKKYRQKLKTIKKRKRPLIGFVGAVNYRLDYVLLYLLAKSNPHWDFVIWGKLMEQNFFRSSQLKYYSKLIKLTNVKRGYSGKDRIPSIINQFDVGIIPYDISQDFNRYCFPMKIFEYFYMGKPVVSTDIVELRRFPEYIKIGNNYKQWQDILSKLIARPWSTKKQIEENNIAIDNSWKNKISVIWTHVK